MYLVRFYTGPVPYKIPNLLGFPFFLLTSGKKVQMFLARFYMRVARHKIPNLPPVSFFLLDRCPVLVV